MIYKFIPKRTEEGTAINCLNSSAAPLVGFKEAPTRASNLRKQSVCANCLTV